MSLADEPCACGPDTPRLDDAEQTRLLASLNPDWTLAEGRLTRTWKLPDFMSGVALVNRIAPIAEEANHHPDVFLAWGQVRLELWTHSVSGLTRADFVLAARLDRL